MQRECYKGKHQIQDVSSRVKGFPGAASDKEPACQCRRREGRGFSPLEEGMATHSSILAWRIPCAEELGGLQFMGSQRVRHDLETELDTVITISRTTLLTIVFSIIL